MTLPPDPSQLPLPTPPDPIPFLLAAYESLCAVTGSLDAVLFSLGPVHDAASRRALDRLRMRVVRGRRAGAVDLCHAMRARVEARKVAFVQEHAVTIAGEMAEHGAHPFLSMDEAGAQMPRAVQLLALEAISRTLEAKAQETAAPPASGFRELWELLSKTAV